MTAPSRAHSAEQACPADDRGGNDGQFEAGARLRDRDADPRVEHQTGDAIERACGEKDEEAIPFVIDSGVAGGGGIAANRVEPASKDGAGQTRRNGAASRGHGPYLPRSIGRTGAILSDTPIFCLTIMCKSDAISGRREGQDDWRFDLNR